MLFLIIFNANSLTLTVQADLQAQSWFGRISMVVIPEPATNGFLEWLAQNIYSQEENLG